MVSLQELPVEILDLIFGYTSSSSQWALILTCKQLCEFVRPWLYGTVEFNLTEDIVAGTKQAPIVGFILSIIGNPLFASFVQDFTVRGSKPLTLPIPFTKDQLREWVKYTSPHSGTSNRWSTQLRKGGTDAIIAALICSFKNLRALRLGYDIWSDSVYLGPRLLTLFGLQEVEFESEALEPAAEHGIPDIFRTVRGPVSYDITPLQCLLFLPNIRTISCLAAEPKNGGDIIPPQWSHRRPSNTLTRLVFNKSELKPSTLGKILAVTPQLCQLEYRNWIDAHTDGGMTQYFECEHMDAALQPVRSSLELLKIEIEFFTLYAIDIGWGIHWGVEGNMQSLAHFPRLSHLEIPFVVLLGWKPEEGNTDLSTLLPPSLKSLSLTAYQLNYFEYYEWGPLDIYPRIHTYVKGRDRHAPELEHIELWVDDEAFFARDEPGFNEYVKLKDLCFEANITLGGDSENCRGPSGYE